jgi:hypothetical protein
MKIKTQTIRNYRSKSVLREKIIDMSTYIKNKEISNKWPNVTSQVARKTRIS